MVPARKRTLSRLGAAALMGLSLVLVGGCSKGKGTVTGTVKLHDGTPVSAGNITFWGSDNHPVQSRLKGDGSYSVTDVPAGDVKVTIEPPPPRMGPGGMAKPPPGMSGMPADMIPKGEGDPTDPGTMTIVPVPDKYKKADSTPLTYTVVKGAQQKDFTLEQ